MALPKRRGSDAMLKLLALSGIINVDVFLCYELSSKDYKYKCYFNILFSPHGFK
jgi:hypothetical protein